MPPEEEGVLKGGLDDSLKAGHDVGEGFGGGVGDAHETGADPSFPLGQEKALLTLEEGADDLAGDGEEILRKGSREDDRVLDHPHQLLEELLVGENLDLFPRLDLGKAFADEVKTFLFVDQDETLPEGFIVDFGVTDENLRVGGEDQVAPGDLSSLDSPEGEGEGMVVDQGENGADRTGERDSRIVPDHILGEGEGAEDLREDLLENLFRGKPLVDLLEGEVLPLGGIQECHLFQRKVELLGEAEGRLGGVACVVVGDLPGRPHDDLFFGSLVGGDPFDSDDETPLRGENLQLVVVDSLGVEVLQKESLQLAFSRLLVGGGKLFGQDFKKVFAHRDPSSRARAAMLFVKFRIVRIVAILWLMERARRLSRRLKRWESFRAKS